MFKRKLLSTVLLVGLLFSQAVYSVSAATCNQALFVSDLTAPDGSAFAPDTVFTKTWRLKNVGTCTWNTSYKVLWVGGDQIGVEPLAAADFTEDTRRCQQNIHQIRE